MGIKKNAGPVALYPTVGVWRGRDAKRCKSYSGKTKNASESRTASKRPAIPLVSMVTPKNQPPPCFDCQKCQKLTLGGYLGLSLSQKSILRALSCLYIPIYTHP